MLVIEPQRRPSRCISSLERHGAGWRVRGTRSSVCAFAQKAATREVIGEPEFHKRAKSVGGAFTGGKTSKNMLKRIVTVMSTTW